MGYNSATKKTLTMTYSLVNDGILISWFIIIIPTELGSISSLTYP